ncbi:MAG: glycoside hydrolase family 1 protein [Chlamydiales bacterium]|nr:glycoside hydrolase family 1 protein [Chlamydiales bacterium]
MTKQQFGDFHKVLEDPTLWHSFGDFKNAPPLGHGNPHFLFGVATSMFQDSGATHCPESQWSDWESRCLPVNNRSGAAVNLFELYRTAPQEVIKRLKLLTVNTYRFSIEWSHLEPEQGKFNHEKLQTYVEFCKALRDHEIQPLITLHHFSEPRWFHEMDSFEKEENIEYFRTFCKWAFKELVQEYKGAPLVQLFCTINEPSIEANCRYVVGYFSPGLYCRFSRAARFLLNLLKAHCCVYADLKEIAREEKREGIKIGITHQYLQFSPQSFFMKPVTSSLNKFHEAVLNFFKTGRFECKIPLLCNVVEECAETLKPKADFAGVQFYGRVYLGLKGVLSLNKPQTTMQGIYEDPEGLFEAIVSVHEAFNAPVIVSENGISTECDEQRARYLSRALYSAEQAREKIGPENMLGYIIWSFSDNFEWFLGWKPRFGAFSLTKERTLSEEYKPGVQPFVEMISAWKASL